MINQSETRIYLENQITEWRKDVDIHLHRCGTLEDDDEKRQYHLGSMIALTLCIASLTTLANKLEGIE